MNIKNKTIKIFRKAFKWVTKTRRRKILSSILAITIVITSIRFLLFSIGDVEAAWSPTHSLWGKRKRLEITNDSTDSLASGTAVSVSIDTKSLYQLGKVQDDCDDLRIVYQPNSTTFTELTRHLIVPGGVSCGSNGSTRVYFQLQSALAAATDSTDYYIYYDNSDASTPSSTDNVFDVGSKDATLVCSFDGTTTCAADETPSTSTGAMRYEGEKGALYFDGKSDYLTMGSDSSIDDLPLEDFTVEMWVYFPETYMDFSTFQLLNKHHWTEEGWQIYGTKEFESTSASRNLQFQVEFSGTDMTVNTDRNEKAVIYDEWVHYAFTFDSELKRGRIFVNGTEASYYQQYDGDGSYNSGNTRDMSFGNQDALGTLRFFSGYLDEVRVSNVIRYDSDFTPQTTPFVRDDYTKLLLHLDETGDDPRGTTVAFDDSGNGNDATIGGGAKYVQGLVGKDDDWEGSGYLDGGNSFASHQGIFLEEETTNKITNPSFEHSTYSTSWTASASAQLSENTSIPFYKFGSKSAKLEAAYTSYPWAPDMSYKLQGLYTATSNKRLSQGFQVSSAVSPTTASLGIDRDGSNTTYYQVEIQTDSSGVPSGTPVSNGTSDCKAWNDIEQSGDIWGKYTDFIFSTAPSLSSSTQYHLVLIEYTNSGCTTEQTVAHGSNYVRWNYDDTSSSYSNGDRATMNESSTWTTQTNEDHRFAISNDASVLTTVNVGNTNDHTFSVYAYNNTSKDSTIDASDVRLIYDATPIDATYTDMGGGWFRISHTTTGVNSSTTYGVEVRAGRIIYLDGFQLEEKDYPTTYADGSLTSDVGGANTYFWDDDCDGTLDGGEDETADQNTQCSTRTVADFDYAISTNIQASEGSVSLWIKPNWDGDDGVEHALWDTDTSAGTLKLYKTTGNVLTLTDGTNTATTSISGWSKDEWHHVVATWDGTNYLDIYVDSSAGSGSAAYSAPTLTTSLYIGQDKANTDLVNSTISDLRIWDNDLTSAEVTDLYYSGLLAHSEKYEVDRFSGEKGQDPVAIWHFDESYGSTVNDSSKYGNDLTLYNSPSWNTDSVGSHARLVRSLEFDGSDDIASASADIDFNFSDESFSIAGWFRHSSSISGTDTILARYQDAGYKIYMNSSGYICAAIDDDSTWSPDDETCSTSDQGSYADSKWHHFEMVKDGTSSLTLYIDGAMVHTDNTISATGSLNSNSGIFIGADSNNSNYWTGFLDEIVIYPYARTADQVKGDVLGSQTSALFGTDPKDYLSEGLVGYWKLDEYSDGTGQVDRSDSSGNGNDLTDNNTTPSARGVFNYSGDFTATNSENLTRTDASLNGLELTSSFTLSAWVNIDSAMAGCGEIIAKNDNNDSNYFIDICDSSPGVGFDEGDGDWPNLYSAEDLTQNIWYFITGVFDNSRDTLAIYINGELSSSITTTGTPQTNNLTFAIGRDYGTGGHYFDGQIDEARVYNRALSPAEIQALYKWAPGPVAYYPLDEGTGTSTFYDHSGNDNNLTPAGLSESDWVAGKYGRAVNFDGAALANISDNASLSIEYDTTLSAWIKPDATTASTTYTIAGKWEGSNESYSLVQYGDEIRMYIDSSSNYETTDAANLQVGTWYHVEGVYDASAQTVTIYINGIEEASTTTGTIPSSIGDDASDFYISGSDSTPITEYPAADTDDGHEYPQDTWNDTIWIGHYGSSDEWGAIRFTSVNVDGAISDATLRLYYGGNYDGFPVYTKARAEAIDSASAPSISNLPSDMTLTSAGTDFDFESNPANGWKEVDVTSAVQEVLDRPGWLSGNHINIVIENDGSTGNNDMEFNDQSTANDPELIINPLGDPYVGTLDEIRVYNYVRTEQQVVEDMNAGHPTPGSPIGSALSHWMFDEGYGDTANDSGTGGNNGNLAGSGTSCPQTGTTACPSWTNDGKYDKALDFDGTDDYVEINGVAGNVDETNFSISGWIKGPGNYTGTTWGSLIGINDSGGGNVLMLAIGDNVAGVALDNEFNVYDGGSSSFEGDTNTVIADNSWHNFVYTRSGSTGYLYVDGTLRNTHAANYTFANNDTWSIAMEYDTATPTDFIDGIIDDIRIYSSALSADQIKAVYNQGSSAVWGATSTDSSGAGTWSSANEYCPPGQGSACTAPVAEWKLDEKTGSNSYDTSENNNIGTLSGHTAWKHAGDCYKGACLEFDGTNDWVDYGNDSTLNNMADWTYEAWVYPTSIPASQKYFMGKARFGSGEKYFGLDNSGNGRIRCMYEGDTGQVRLRITNETLSLNEWAHVVCTADPSASNDFHIYINGVEATYFSTTNGTSADNDSTENFRVGANHEASYDFTGMIDDVRVYDYPRTLSQVAWSYNRGGPLGHWQLDECTGDTAYDIGSGGNNGTLNIGATGDNDEAGNCSSADSTHAWYNGIDGKVNYSLDFDGTDDNITTSSISHNILTGDFTFAAWVYKNSDNGNSYQGVMTNGDYAPAMYVEVNGSNNWGAYWGSVRQASEEWPVGSWHHMVMLRRSGYLYFYKDGVQDENIYNVTTSMSNDIIRLGSSSSVTSNHADVKIDDARLYNYALTHKQIINIMNQSAVYFGPSTGHP